MYVYGTLEANGQQVESFSFSDRVSSSGDLVVPFATLGVTASAAAHVEQVVLVFSDCPWRGNPCGATAGFAPRRYRIGAPSFDTDDSSPAARHSWGALKATYR